MLYVLLEYFPSNALKSLFIIENKSRKNIRYINLMQKKYQFKLKLKREIFGIYKKYLNFKYLFSTTK